MKKYKIEIYYLIKNLAISEREREKKKFKEKIQF